VSLLSATLCQ